MLVIHPKLLLGRKSRNGLWHLREKKRAQVTTLRNQTEIRDEGTHRLGVTLEGIGGYIDGLGLGIFVPFLNLVHCILVTGGSVHICSRWDGGKMLGGRGHLVSGS
jgi:hypothetical protein